jgi:hypothetical protein
MVRPPRGIGVSAAAEAACLCSCFLSAVCTASTAAAPALNAMHGNAGSNHTIHAWPPPLNSIQRNKRLTSVLLCLVLCLLCCAAAPTKCAWHVKGVAQPAPHAHRPRHVPWLLPSVLAGPHLCLVL